ncbi:LysM peptidoglycan-binding domain-containing protein [candidate division KSB1 bacterium]|nr:LysM peptidoglycan-binding domain-containing protein [candidate division KSB1 bacterium]
MKKILAVSAFVALVMMLAVSLSFAQEEMTMEEYNAQLAEWQQREADAKAAIETTEQEIEEIKNEIAQVEDEIKNEWQEIYALLGVTEEDVNDYRNNLDGLESEVDGLASLPPEELFKRRQEIDQLEENLNNMKESNIALLSEMQNKIAEIEGKIMALRNSMPKAIYDEYTVVRGDYLWKIAGKDDIYDDPYQWMRIYTYNKDQIKDPDVIYADQIFKIQREVGPNEYLVVKGDWLGKIASNPEIYNDPTKWTKIFEANQEFISDKNMIYPYQVLTIPE